MSTKHVAEIGAFTQTAFGEGVSLNNHASGTNPQRLTTSLSDSTCFIPQGTNHFTMSVTEILFS